MAKTTILSAFAGFALGTALLGAVGWTAVPGMMLKETPSPYGLQETVDRISENAKQDGKTYLGYMNAGLLGRLFGGNVADVPGTVSQQQQSFIAFAL